MSGGDKSDLGWAAAGGEVRSVGGDAPAAGAGAGCDGVSWGGRMVRPPSETKWSAQVYQGGGVGWSEKLRVRCGRAA